MSDALKQIWERVDAMIGPMRKETEMEHIARDMREGRFPARSDPIQVPVNPPKEGPMSDYDELTSLVSRLLPMGGVPAPYAQMRRDAADAITALQARVETLTSERDFFQSEVKLRNRIPGLGQAEADLVRRAEAAEAALAEARTAACVRPVGAEQDLAADILAELSRARAKFPGKNVTFAALVEEVGELATATFEESAVRVRKEAIQVAVMAMRMVLDGDHCFDDWRAEKGLDHLDPTLRALAEGDPT